MQKFPIVYHEKNCGTAKVWKDGLYYRISCHCKHRTGMYQILVTGEHGTVNLGTCMLTGTGIGLDTKIAIKRLAAIISFDMIEKYKEESRLIFLVPDKPIRSLAVLGKSRLFQNNDGWELIEKED